MSTSFLSLTAKAKVTALNWNEQWSAPSSRLERLAPWLALGTAALIALW